MPIENFKRFIYANGRFENVIAHELLWLSSAYTMKGNPSNRNALKLDTLPDSQAITIRLIEFKIRLQCWWPTFPTTTHKKMIFCRLIWFSMFVFFYSIGILRSLCSLFSISRPFFSANFHSHRLQSVDNQPALNRD